jgi:GAF domain-containing protein
MPIVSANTITIPIESRQQILELLASTIRKDNADKATLQVFDEPTESLHLIASEGFEPEFLDHFLIVKAFSGAACGRAIGVGNPVIISDVFLDAAFEPHLPIIKSAGYRSVKAIPIFGQAYKKMGVISTHFREPKWSWDLKSIEAETEAFSSVLSTVMVHQPVVI